MPLGIVVKRFAFSMSGSRGLGGGEANRLAMEEREGKAVLRIAQSTEQRVTFVSGKHIVCGVPVVKGIAHCNDFVVCDAAHQSASEAKWLGFSVKICQKEYTRKRDEDGPASVRNSK